MCGASPEQKNMYAKQSAFYDVMTRQYQEVYGKQQAILDGLAATLKPIFEKGPNQRGFSPEVHTALDTQATEATATGYAHAKQSLHNAQAERGGGEDFLPSGVDAQLDAGLSATAEAQNAQLHQNIEMSDFDAGRKLWMAAGEGLSGVAGQQNAANFANATTNSGNAAADTANQIAAASNSIWGSVIGGLSGIAGSAVGGWATGLAGKGK